MKRSLLKILIVVIGISLTSATIFTAISLSGEPKLYSYIPNNSEFVSHFTFENGSYYMFATNTSYAVLLNTPVLQIENSIFRSSSIGNITSNITIDSAMSYHGYSIFVIKGVGLTQVMGVMGFKSLNLSIPLPAVSLSVYITDLTTKYSIIGSLSGVLESINASLDNTGFSNFKTFINENIPFSSAIFLGHNSIPSRITINITLTSTYITVYAGVPIVRPILLNISNFFVGVHNISSQSITFVIGVGWSQIQSVLSDLINTLSQQGGLNVKNYTGVPVLF